MKKNIHFLCGMLVHEHACTLSVNIEILNWALNQKRYMEFKTVYMCTHWQAHSSAKQIWDKKQYMHNNLI